MLYIGEPVMSDIILETIVIDIMALAAKERQEYNKYAFIYAIDKT